MEDDSTGNSHVRMLILLAGRAALIGQIVLHLRSVGLSPLGGGSGVGNQLIRIYTWTATRTGKLYFVRRLSDQNPSLEAATIGPSNRRVGPFMVVRGM